MKRIEKKVVLFLVEGVTDQESLALILSKLLQDDEVQFHVIHGDITANQRTPPENPAPQVMGQVRQFLDRYRYRLSDLKQIVHLVDMDGAFVPDECVCLGTMDRIRYFSDRIETSSPESILARNRHKRKVLNHLSSLSAIGSVPYAIYFFSCNLEHVLHNERRSMTSREKVRYAQEFTDRFYDCPRTFLSFIRSHEFAVTGEYEETWRFIRGGTHSLNRYSNFHLFFS